MSCPALYCTVMNSTVQYRTVRSFAIYYDANVLSPTLNSCVNYCAMSCHYISCYVMPFCLLQSINYLLCYHILSHPIPYYLVAFILPLSYLTLANDETATLAAKQCLTVMTTHSSTILKQYTTALLL